MKKKWTSSHHHYLSQGHLPNQHQKNYAAAPEWAHDFGELESLGHAARSPQLPHQRITLEARLWHCSPFCCIVCFFCSILLSIWIRMTHICHYTLRGNVWWCRCTFSLFNKGESKITLSIDRCSKSCAIDSPVRSEGIAVNDILHDGPFHNMSSSKL